MIGSMTIVSSQTELNLYGASGNPIDETKTIDWKDWRKRFVTQTRSDPLRPAKVVFTAFQNDKHYWGKHDEAFVMQKALDSQLAEKDKLIRGKFGIEF